MFKKDVHEYDSKLLNVFNVTTIINTDEKINIIKKFLDKKIITNNNSINMINLMLNDTNNNFQKENNVNCLDILVDIILNKNYKDTLHLFEEQLSDIMLGTCPSGRVTRLLQYWIILENK